jgi:hypothetical protein
VWCLGLSVLLVTLINFFCGDTARVLLSVMMVREFYLVSAIVCSACNAWYMLLLVCLGFWYLSCHDGHYFHLLPLPVLSLSWVLVR